MGLLAAGVHSGAGGQGWQRSLGGVGDLEAGQEGSARKEGKQASKNPWEAGDMTMCERRLHSPGCRLHCPIRFTYQNTNSEMKLSRISRLKKETNFTIETTEH